MALCFYRLGRVTLSAVVVLLAVTGCDEAQQLRAAGSAGPAGGPAPAVPTAAGSAPAPSAGNGRVSALFELTGSGKALALYVDDGTDRGVSLYDVQLPFRKETKV